MKKSMVFYKNYQLYITTNTIFVKHHGFLHIYNEKIHGVLQKLSIIYYNKYDFLSMKKAVRYELPS